MRKPNSKSILKNDYYLIKVMRNVITGKTLK